MKDKLLQLKIDFEAELGDISTLEAADELEKKFTGKSGALKEILKGLKNLPVEDKKVVGPEANKLKVFIESAIADKKVTIEEAWYAQLAEKEAIDVTLEFPSKDKGHKHPISIASNLLEEIFISLGFQVKDGPHIETEELNFDKLNIPDDHPARDVWDTFWVSDDINDKREPGDKYLLRTHTSPVQIRTMMSEELPIKIVVPGRVFRYEQEDARHTSNFYQFEGLVVWEWVTFGDLKGTIDTAMKKLLGDKTKTRFRPSIFPFTEPSAEVDVSCTICNWTGMTGKKRCSMCSWTGWVELLGCGMVHPKVLEGCNIDPEKYSGFAFGMWIDRIAAQRFSVSSSRMFYQSKLKLNEQF